MSPSVLEPVVWGAPSFWIERFPLYWGIHKGLFRDRGIDLSIWYSYGGPELAAAVNAGRIHIGEMGLPPFVAAFRQGMAARIIGSSVIRQLDHYVAGRPEYGAMTDLKGRRMGILSTGSCDSYFIRKLMADHGMDADRDVRLVPLGKDYGKVSLLAEDRVDAAFFVEPLLSEGELAGSLRVLARVGDYFPRYQWGIILASCRWLEHRRDLLDRLMDGFRYSCRSIARDPERTLSLGGRVFGVSTEAFAKALQRDLPRWEVDARLDGPGLDNALAVQQAMGADIDGLDLADMILHL